MVEALENGVVLVVAQNGVGHELAGLTGRIRANPHQRNFRICDAAGRMHDGAVPPEAEDHVEVRVEGGACVRELDVAHDLDLVVFVQEI